MAHLRLTEVDEATGLLREEYDAAVRRAGKVFNMPLLTRAHADDLRAEGADDELAARCAHDYRQAELPAPVRALCDYAVKRASASIPSPTGR